MDCIRLEYDVDGENFASAGNASESVKRTLKQLGVRLSLGEHYLDGLAGQQVILRTPGFEYYTPALQAAKACLSHSRHFSSKSLFSRSTRQKGVSFTG